MFKISRNLIVLAANSITDLFGDSSTVFEIKENLIKGNNVETVFEGNSDYQGHLILSNHISCLDWAAIRKHIPCNVITYFNDTSKTVEENLREYGIIPFNYLESNSGEIVKKLILEYTSQGNNILLFPEGKISLKQDISESYKGGIKHAYLNNIPILTVKINFVDKEGNIKTSEHNDTVDLIVYMLNLPVETPIIKVSTLNTFHTVDYPTFDDFYKAICDSYN